MDYNTFLKIINEAKFDKNCYDELKKFYGFDLINKYFSKYINSGNLSEEAYEKCKYFLEDEIKNHKFEISDLRDVNSLTLYLEEISQYDLLTPEEERKILMDLNTLNNVINIYKENYTDDELINNIDYLKKLQEYKLLSNRLIESNLRLVVSVAKHYDNPTIDILDLIQEGNIGLKTAVNKFDITKGNRFSTYAIWWIRQHIVREIHMNSRTIKLPVNKHELLYKIKKLTSLFERQYNRLPSNEELISYIKEKIKDGSLSYNKCYDYLTSDSIEDLKKISQHPTSINAKVGEDEDSTLEEFIASDYQESIENIVEKKLISDDIKVIFDDICPRYKLIIILRFGFSINKYMDYEEFLNCFSNLEYSEVYYRKLYMKLCQCQRMYTLEQIAKIYGITRERIRQMESKTLHIIKRKNQKLKILQPDFLDLYK